MNTSNPLDIPRFAENCPKVHMKLGSVTWQESIVLLHITLLSSQPKKKKKKKRAFPTTGLPVILLFSSSLSIYLSGLSISDEALTAKVILLCICIGRNASYSSYFRLLCTLMQAFLYRCAAASFLCATPDYPNAARQRCFAFDHHIASSQ